MLSYILGLVQKYEREHGDSPDTLYLNPEHCLAIERDCPGILADAKVIPMGLKIQVLPASSLPHPHVGRAQKSLLESLQRSIPAPLGSRKGKAEVIKMTRVKQSKKMDLLHA